MEHIPVTHCDLLKRYPMNGIFEFTLRCNLHCKMCLFRHADCENKQLMNDELTTEQWIQLGKEAADMGTMSLLITGGEPMIRSDFCEIWEGIYKQGFIITLYTNATLVNDKIMETLRKYPPHTIGVTIYGASDETYEKVCGIKDGFHRMKKGVEQLRTLPSLFEFRSTLIKDSYLDMEQIEDFVSKEYGKDYVVRFTSPINKAVRGGCSKVEECRLDAKTEYMSRINRVIRIYKKALGDKFDINCLHMNNEQDNECKLIENEDTSKPSLFGCSAGVNQYIITYDGKLIGCQMIDCFSTNVKELGLKEAWLKYPTKVRFPDTEIKCVSCLYNETCPACYATRYAETGDLNGCSDYIYEGAKIRKEFKL